MKNWMIRNRYIFMEQESFNIGIIGGGPAGCACAYFVKKFYPNVKLSIIDKTPMKTILPTGGGRCNLANAEYDFKELAKNYPRGEKFLYSIFSRFSTSDTLELFDELGIETFIQEDGRIFPKSQSSKEVYDKFINELNLSFVKETALRIEKINNSFKVVTDMNSYNFDKLVCAIGGHRGYDIIKRLGIDIIEPKPALVGLVTKEKFSSIMGLTVKNVFNYETGLVGDILFTHYGISGPLIYKISSIFARKNLPYKLTFSFIDNLENFQNILNDNPHKYIKNILSDMIPQNFASFILEKEGINPDLKSHNVDGKTRDTIINSLQNFGVNIISTKKDGETVTAGGVNLDRINPKTMGSKDIKNLYFCGEVIDVDGFCGGFNLQNCWSTAFVCANYLFKE